MSCFKRYKNGVEQTIVTDALFRGESIVNTSFRDVRNKCIICGTVSGKDLLQ